MTELYHDVLSFITTCLSLSLWTSSWTLVPVLDIDLGDLGKKDPFESLLIVLLGNEMPMSVYENKMQIKFLLSLYPYLYICMYVCTFAYIYLSMWMCS